MTDEDGASRIGTLPDQITSDSLPFFLFFLLNGQTNDTPRRDAYDPADIFTTAQHTYDTLRRIVPAFHQHFLTTTYDKTGSGEGDAARSNVEAFARFSSCKERSMSRLGPFVPSHFRFLFFLSSCSFSTMNCEKLPEPQIELLQSLEDSG